MASLPVLMMTLALVAQEPQCPADTVELSRDAAALRLDCVRIAGLPLEQIRRLDPIVVARLSAEDRSAMRRREAVLELALRAGRAPKLSSRLAADPPSWMAGLWRGKDDALAENSEIAVDAAVLEEKLTANSIEEFNKTRGLATTTRLPGPPLAWRYVRDPAAAGRVIDMRHFLQVGARSQLFGLGIEIEQWIEAHSPFLPRARREGMAHTAFNPQDFYSNALGVQFFDKHYKADGGPLGKQVAAFLRSRGGADASR